MAKQSVRFAVLVAPIALTCMLSSLFAVASARVIRLELRGHHIALDDTASNTIASSRRVLNGIEDDFVMYKDTACDDDTIEKARALGDWESCRMWCSETPDCVAFDYNEKSGKCYLKGSWTKISAGNGHISGVVKEKAEGIAAMAVGVLATAFQRMEDMECGGDEISDGILNDVKSREMCEEACESRAAQGCRAYTWNKFNKRCYLKKDDCVGENADIGRFSGRMMTSPDSAQQTVSGDSLEPNFKRMDETECGGSEIPGGMIKGVESRESCEAACARRDTCKAYTWNSIDKRCYLKRDACIPESPDMGRFSGRLVEDAQSMEMEVKEETEDLVVDTIDESSCPETNPPANSDFDEVDGKVCDGNEFDVIDLKDCYKDSPTRENCGGECASNADCVSYSFDIYSKLCFLYSEDSCLTSSDNSIYESGLDFASDDGSYGSDY